MTITSAGNPTRQETFVASVRTYERTERLPTPDPDSRHEVLVPMGLSTLVAAPTAEDK